MPSVSERFWENKTLEQLDAREWELLCDGCARCCVAKQEDEETGEVTYTSLACRFLDLESCRCTCYGQRSRLEPECADLDPQNVRRFDWLPATCAYRRLALGEPLPDWHPLLSGDPDSTRKAGMSVRDRVAKPLSCPDDRP